MTFSNPHTIILLYDNIVSLCAGAAASAALPKDRRDTVHMEREYKMSAARAQELQEELNYLKTTRSDEVAEQIKVARGFGDLSENSEYDEAKNEQGLVEGRIALLEKMLKHARVVTEDELSTDHISVGSHVRIKDEDGDEDEYDITGSTEADPVNGKISDESPIGAALIGHSVGDKVDITLPSGAVVQYEVMEIGRAEL